MVDTRCRDERLFGKVNYEMKNVGSLFMNHDLFDEVHELLARDFDELNRKYKN